MENERQVPNFWPSTIDAKNWSIIREMILAAHDKNISRFGTAALRLDTDVAVDDRAGLYVAYLLWKRVADLLKREPAAHDFRQLAEQVHADVSSILKVDIEGVDNTIRTVFSQADEKQQVSGPPLILSGAAILGALLENLPSELDEMYPKLANWYKRTFPERER